MPIGARELEPHRGSAVAVGKQGRRPGWTGRVLIPHSAAKRSEIGVVVADASQRQGVGAALLRALTDRARARGISGLEMEVLAENLPVLAMIASHWPDARYERRAAYISVRATLPQHREERPRAAVLR